MAAGTITIKLTAKDGELQAAFTRARRALIDHEKFADVAGRGLRRAFGLGLTASAQFAAGTIRHLTSVKAAVLGLVATVGIARFVRSLDAANDRVDQLGKRARTLGVPVQFLSGLDFAAKLANVEFDALATSSARALKNMSEFARTGGGPAKRALQELNLPLRDINGNLRPLDELLSVVGRALGEIDDKGRQLDLATQIFGRSGGERFIQLIGEMGGKLQDLPAAFDQARRLGVIFTPEQFTRAQGLADSITRFQVALMGLRVAIVQEIAPDVERFLNTVANRIGDIATVLPTAARAFRDITFGANDQTKRAALSEFSSAATSLLTTTAAEIGKVIGVTFIEAIEIGLRAIAPTLEDIFRDTLGPVLNEIPGVDIAPSQRGKVAQAREEFHAIFAEMARAESDARQRRADFDRLDPGLQAYISSANQGRKPGLGAGEEFVIPPETMARIVASLQRIDDESALVATQATERAQAISQAFSDGFSGASAQGVKAAERIAAAADAFELARGNLLALYQTADPGAAASPMADLDKLVTSLAAHARQMGDSLAAAGQRLRRDLFPERGRDVFDKLAQLQAATTSARAEALESAGDERAARRLQTQAAFAQQIQRARREFGPMAAPVVGSLAEAQRIELDRLDAGPLRQIEIAWVDSAKRMKEQSRDLGAVTSTVLEDFAGGFASKLSTGLTQGEISFRNFASSVGRILGDLGRQVADTLLQFAIRGLVGTAIGGFGTALGFQGAGVASPAPGVYGPPAPAARGMLYDASTAHVLNFGAGAVVSTPHSFPIAGGRTGVFGEAGLEAMMPVTRIGGILGVRSTGGGTLVQVFDQRRGGDPVQVTRTQGPDGREVLRILVRDEVRRGLAQGDFDRPLASNFGLTRPGIAR